MPTAYLVYDFFRVQISLRVPIDGYHLEREGPSHWILGGVGLNTVDSRKVERHYQNGYLPNDVVYIEK